jgi:putative transposase
MGLLLQVVVHPANLQDRDGALLVLSKLWYIFPRLHLIWADGGYSGTLVDWVMTHLYCALVIIKRTDDVRGFKLLPRRWVVERTFAWISFCRRLSKDYEELPRVSEAFIRLAMIRLMVRRLSRRS